MSARAASHPRRSAPQRDVAAPHVRLAPADASNPPVLSPARIAQLELAARLADEPVVEGRWHPRQGIALAVVGSVVLWGAVAMIGAAIIS